MSQDDRPDLELDLPGDVEPGADLELDQPRQAPLPTPARPEGPWREPERLTRWALADTTREPLHPFELLGGPSGHAELLSRLDACRRHLRHLAEAGGREAAIATLILDSPRFTELRKLSEGDFQAELRRAQFATEAWYALARDARRIVADGQLSDDEDRELDRWAQRMGWTRATLDEALIEQVDPRFSVLERVRAAPGLRLRLLSGVVITSAEQLREVALSGPERWQETAESLRDLGLVLDHLHGDEAERLRAALDEGRTRAPNGGKILWLQATLWAIGPLELRLPEPWSPGVCLDPAGLVQAVYGDASLLMPALRDGRLGLWLERFPGQDALARALTDREVDPQLRAHDLLWALGGRRLSLAGQVVDDPGALRALLESDPAVHADFDALLARRVLQAWARVRGDTQLADAAARAALGADATMRRRIFVWALGSPELVPGVTTLSELVELARREPLKAGALLSTGELSAWALSRGLLQRPLERVDGSPNRRLHEALWALNARTLLLRERVFPTPDALIAQLDEGLLLHLEPLELDGTLGMWLALHLCPLVVPGGEAPALALRRRLWAAGWTAFHHPDFGLFPDPAALGELDRRAGALPLLAASGWLPAWLELSYPALLDGLRLAMASEDPDEALARALGQPAPTIEIDQDELDFGGVTEGSEATLTLTLRHRGPRGRARVSVALQDPRTTLSLPGADSRGQLTLGPGQRAEVSVRLVLPPGEKVRGEAELQVLVDGVPRALPLRYRSRFDLGGLLLWGCGGAAVGALALGLWQGLLIAVSGQSMLASDGGLLTDVAQITAGGPPNQLGRLSLVLWALALGGTALSIGLRRLLRGRS